MGTPGLYKIFIVIVLFNVANVLSGQQKEIELNYEISGGAFLNLGNSSNLYFSSNGFAPGWEVNFNVNIPISYNYFLSAGVGVSSFRTSLLYNSDSIKTDYFEKVLDTRGMIWELDASYFVFPVLINMQTNPLNNKTNAVIGAGFVSKQKFQSYFNIYNRGVTEYENIQSVRDYNLSFIIRIGIKHAINDKHKLLMQLFYEHSLLPVQTFQMPEMKYEMIGLRLGWNFNIEGN